ncbi:sulfatase [Aquimarina spongiae]|uniref:Arylsulfatase A n=1 Tax=Aquimarina spongiae TaxID=570521 RepID=A0A1M6A1J7_9FLAO|nr:sulfatase [Aquimarina spongiae]SHI30391.1 Arylsulfatase A [Aquimarina spongiae]
MKLFHFAFLLLLIGGCKQKELSKKDIQEETKPNILFIAIDDLRPELGCYGSEIAITPNIDSLAANGLLFNKAYTQQAICSPSRASLMTGSRPETIKVVENYAYFRDVNPDIITLPQHFKDNGYETIQIGKIYHKPSFSDPELSWSREPALERMKFTRETTPGGFALPENQKMYKENKADMIAKYGKDAASKGLGKGPAYEKADVPDYFYEDGYNALLAKETLKELKEKNSGKPFFLGVGFKKPHLDWLAPKKYWDMYTPENIKLSSQTEGPENGAAMGLHPSFELRVRSGIPKKGKINDSLARVLKHAYLSSVTYIDAQIGKVIQTLEELDLRENTIILLWSDHGWHLGEMGIWGKATNYEISTRVPMIINTPNMHKSNKGTSTEALVELVDMYPTLVELAGLHPPEHLEGQSFVPLLQNPNMEWKKAAFSQFPSPALREWAANPLSQGMRETYFGPLIVEVEEKIKNQQQEKWDRVLFENNLMGYAMRTKTHRLIVWKDYTDKEKPPVFLELYDHISDPEESVNIANENPEIVAKLLEQFNRGWKGNMASK